MAQETIQAVKKAEQNAAQMEVEAKKKAEEMIQKAQKEASEIIATAVKGANEDQEKELQKAHAIAKVLKESAKMEMQNELDGLRKSAEKGKADAIRMIQKEVIG